MYKSSAFYKNIFKGINLRAKQLFHKQRKKVNINWFLIKYLKHLPPDKIHSYQLLYHETYFYSGPGFLHGLQEIFIGEIYNQQLPENAYIIDCGAYIGLSVIYLKSICHSAHIICFEPDKKNFDLLQKNILSHQLKNIDAKEEAVWIETTSLNFLQKGSMDSKIVDNTSTDSITVKATRLKNYLDQKVDFLKMDIEGAEYLVLKDIEEKLHYVKNMFVEYHGSFAQNHELLEIFQIIVKSGFAFYVREAAVNYTQPFLHKNAEIDYDVQLNIFCFRKF
jgi:FkbM family methyltransferase